MQLADIRMSLYPLWMAVLEASASTFTASASPPAPSTDRVLEALRAVGEPTRLRIVVLLRHGELTVSDLTEILGQSQPRVSRHLRLLVEAGLVTRHREGAWAFFGLTSDPEPQPLLDTVDGLLDEADPLLAADRQRLRVVRAQRASTAREYFERIAAVWDEERSLHAPDDAVEAAIIELLGSGPLGDLLDLGTGTGRMLQLLGDRADRCVGLDTSHSMLSVARANLDRLDPTRYELRQGDVYGPPVDLGSFDVVVIHQVLHYLDDPARAVLEATRLVAPGGRLLLVDFAPHDLEFLREGHAHRRLGFADEQIQQWTRQAGLRVDAARTLPPPIDEHGLTVCLWLMSRPAAVDVDLGASA